MKCRQVSDLISWYADGRLSADRAEAVRLHIESCSCCRAEMAAEQLSARALSMSVRSFSPPDVLAQVKGRVSRRPVTRPRWQWAFAGLAAVCALTWFSLSLMHESPSAQQTPVHVTSREIPPAHYSPEMKVERTATSEKAIQPSKPKTVVAYHRAPKPRRPVVHHTPKHERVAPPPEIEYMVVYQHPGLGDGIQVATSDANSGSSSGNPASSSYSIRMTDESTGRVTGVSAYSSSDGTTEESARVNFRSDTPNVDEPERSSTDEKPLHTLSGTPRSDLC